MALKQQQVQKQQQGLTQMQIQQIKLLEIPALEMEERILREIDSNPALELGEDIPSDNNLNEEDDFDLAENYPENEENDKASENTLSDYEDDYDDRAADYAETQAKDPNADNERGQFFLGVQTDSLQDFLRQQLSDLDLEETENWIGEYIIGCLDDDGYLRIQLETIADQLSFHRSLDVDEEQMEEVLTMIQGFEPAGIAARNLKECLLLQLQRKNPTKEVQQAIHLLENYFEDFSAMKIQKICQDWGISESEMNAVKKTISKLNPKPGNDWESSLMNETGRAITPDFLVDNSDGKLSVSLNDTNLPDLHVSRYYKDLIRSGKQSKNISRDQKDAIAFAKQKVESATWFINAIRQRQNTLLSTMQAILDRQEAFFLSGEEKKLRPMRLKDVAADTGMDISTISRVSNSKYVQSEFGIFPLKFFFSESMQTTDGEEVSVREIKSIMQELIEAEDKSHALTDDALVKLLQEKGYRIARRTVAKYREQLHIPTARQRSNQ